MSRYLPKSPRSPFNRVNIVKALLGEKDFERAARAIGCSVAAVKAVAKVEAPKGGFLESERPTLLFEAHQFGKYTKYRYNDSHPHLSTTTWDAARKLYKGGEKEWDRFDEAQKLNREAAILSCSWGKFQIMGFNYLACGFKTAQEFVNAMFASEGRQLDAFIEYVKAARLDDELVRKDWVGFALGYNGKSYWKNRYDEKLKAAYRSFGGR